MGQKTMVIGASRHPWRYAYLAMKKLLAYGHEIIAVGKYQDEVDGISIVNQKPDVEDIHTVTLYLNPRHQEEYYEYIVSMKPKRVIFNPGAENPDFARLLKANQIDYENACTLVLLSLDQY